MKKIVLIPLAIAALAALSGASGVSRQDGNFRLNEECPAGFEKLVTGTCAMRTLYDQYTAPDGFGGLRAPLPPRREGFRPQEIDLGRYLFFDPVLSADRRTSCADCHDPDNGFTDGQGKAHGVGAAGAGIHRVDGVTLQRGTPSLWNMAFQRSFFWDGHASSLELQAEGPLLSPIEMANSRTGIEATLNALPSYRKLFAQAYPQTVKRRIDFADVTRALAAFQSSLISLNSRYDRYAHGDDRALTPQEVAGHNIFRSFVTRCSQCHTPPLFTNGQMAVIGSPEPDGQSLDPGAQATDGNATLRGAFKVPSLRNIALTAPYMHSGRFATIPDVIRFYNSGRGNAVPPGEKLQLHWHITTFHLSDDEITALSAFLCALTDTSMMPEIPDRIPSGLPTIKSRSAAAMTRSASGDAR